MLMETRKKISVFFLSSLISSLVKMRDSEMITPAVPEEGTQMMKEMKKVRRMTKPGSES